MGTPERYRSERDFVSISLLPSLKDVAKQLGMQEVLEFHVEERVDGGVADLTAARAGRRLFLVEAKFKRKVGKIERDIEPRDPEVIAQAVNYATNGGFPYYATCNSKRLVLYYRSPEKKPIESEVASFEYDLKPDWAAEVLKIVLGHVPLKLKLLDDVLVDTLHETHADLHREILQSFKQKLDDKEFREKYLEWLQSQGLEFNDATNRLIAEQATYLQITKLLFYGVVQSLYPEKLRPLKIEEQEDVQDALQRFYEDVKKIDYLPIYQTDIISEIPLTIRAEERIRTLVDTLREFDYSQMKRDFLSRVYEKLIPPLERKRLGQFYTPPGIVDFIVQLTINDPNVVVLDPGCGSGSFLVAAYNRLRELNGIPATMEGAMGERFHQQVLNQVYGVDINQFPAHLSVIGLAIQNPQSRVDKVNVVVKDFFDIRRGQATLTGFESLDAEGKATVVEFPAYFDAVVANPPYIRQELLGENEKQKIRKLIQGDYKDKVFIGAPPKQSKNALVLDKQSDIYIYFFIHAISLLKNGGKLGFISSNKWLEVGYGEPFQKFLLDHCKILYVVEFDKAVFPDAEVDAAITILEKEDKEKNRRHDVKFIRLKHADNSQIFVKQLKETQTSIETKNVRINVLEQSVLRQGKWASYLRAPQVYNKLLSHPRVKPLKEICNVRFGVKTGYNDYFVLTKDAVKHFGIESKNLVPCVPSPKNLDNLIVHPEDVKHQMLWVFESTRNLAGKGIAKYLKYGENLDVSVTRGSTRGLRKLPSLESVRSHKPYWYSVPKLQAPTILFPRMIRERFVVFLNEARAQASHVFVYIYSDRESAPVLVAYLNSSLCQFLAELIGRQYTGMLNLETTDIKRIPVIDVKALTPTEKKKIQGAFFELAKSMESRIAISRKYEAERGDKQQKGLFQKEAEEKLHQVIAEERKAQHQLDEVIYDILELSKEERIQVEQGLEELQEIRRSRTQT